MSYVREVEVGNRKIRFEFNKFAKQANGSVMVTSGGTQVLVTVCAAKQADPKTDFFPLGVDYIEKSYAVGRVPSGFVKREGKPSDAATLMARVIDRPLRPCFPKGFRNETVITATVMSYEHGFSPVPLALVGASAALMVSDIPFDGPVAALRLGLEDGQYIIDPLEGTEENSDLDLNIACKQDAVLMVEAGARFLSEEKMLEAIEFAHESMRPLFEMQLRAREEIGKPKWEVTVEAEDQSALKTFQELAVPAIVQAFTVQGKHERSEALLAAKKAVIDKIMEEKLVDESADLSRLWEKELAATMRNKILLESERIDGRKLDEVRPISCEVGTLIKSHGSSLFTRGETQALVSVTLASEDDQQRSESLWNNDEKQRFMLHYNFPPFSVGEARMQRSPGRREIGHGSLAKRALTPVIPDSGDFGYTIRVVSETLESNGSSSMAAVCGGTMALMHAGVPIQAPVAGIAMGLIHDGERSAVLSDILGTEDHLGDMDFKVCGTKDAITALQMDIKIGGLSKELLAKALEQAREGRLHILQHLTDTIAEPSAELAENAPRMFKIKIAADKIRDLIGPGGKNIKRITSESKVKMDIDEGGMIKIAAPDAHSAQMAQSMVRSLISEPEVGDIFLGKVVRITDFGAFVELKPGMDGLCHVTQLAAERIAHASDVAKVGDEMLVKVVDIDRQGRVKLSRKDALGQQPSVHV
ncbi:MAG: polyribonucleotide nucleotidyltransferase [Zetaproteobacteria bacterium]|nr:polyribonucleotide nucleotidyltransferase [Zetaproteobacteria bacterium]